ncbi:hypothetical protein [Undibacterium pigrum]|uniref:Uncharacterized protein n=1 Tax=Undibacterium pigrum TaxID=401470 RepID=A0A318J212_9BURK|nr:hypothetical protein [Undibacterium pigrum]PXX41434.1 hypothetical protein DFR42_10785 [Undibacterium pigrum]
MAEKLEIYFFIPPRVAPNVGLLWNLADKYDLEHVVSGECYSHTLSEDSQDIEYESRCDGIFVNTFAELMTLDADRQFSMRQHWRHRGSGICFSSAFVAVDVGGFVFHLTTEPDDIHSALKKFIGDRYRKIAFWQDLSQGLEATFYSSAKPENADFREIYAHYLRSSSTPWPIVDEGWLRRK